MKTNRSIFVACLLAFPWVEAHADVWVEGVVGDVDACAGANCLASVRDVAVDDQSNIYVTGSFEGTMKFGGMTLTNDGPENAFVAKLDRAGNWVWLSRVSGDLSFGRGVTVDGSGGVYVTGGIRGVNSFGEIDVQAQTEAGTPCAESNCRNVFVAKLDSDGNWLWVRPGGGGSSTASSAVEGRKVKLDSKGNVYFSGVATGNRFGPLIVDDALGNLFVAKLTSDGDWRWVRKVGGGGQNAGLAVDDEGNSFVTAFRLIIPDLYNLHKLDSDGAEVWVVEQGFTHDITLDRVGNIYVLSANPDIGTQFVSKRRSLDGERAWITSLEFRAGKSLVTDDLGDVVLTGRTGGVLLVEKLDTLGNIRWSMTTGDQGTYGSGIVRNSQGEIFFVGEFQGFLMLTIAGSDAIPLLDTGTDGGHAGFIAKLDPDPSNLPLPPDTGPVFFKADRFLLTVETHARFPDATNPFFEVTQGAPVPPVGTAWHVGAVDAMTPPTDVDRHGQGYFVSGWEGTGSVPASGFGSQISYSCAEDADCSEQSGLEDSTCNSPGECETDDDCPAGGGCDLFAGLCNMGTCRIIDMQETSTLTWIYEPTITLDIGKPVPRPDGATAQMPEIELLSGPAGTIAENAFVWSDVDHQLYAVRPVSVNFRWKLESDPDGPRRIFESRVFAFPSDAQLYVAGTPPVDLHRPAESNFNFLSMKYTTSAGADVTQQRFSATGEGFSVLYYTDGPAGDPFTEPSAFEVVKTIRWDKVHSETGELVNLIDAPGPTVIGEPIVDPDHNPDAGSGWAVMPNAPYDGTGSDPAYSREDRTGPIIPVNRVVENVHDELIVVWYQESAPGKPGPIYWPFKTVRYDPAWPDEVGAAVDRIVIDTEKGSELPGQPELDPADFPSAQIYDQPDRTKPGFNPNDEHAMFAPSNTGGEHQAVFALRSDLTDASEPYVLLKYRAGLCASAGTECDADNDCPPDENCDLQWAHKVYKVVPTEGNGELRFQGTAGTKVSPPYPLRLLAACQKTSPARDEQGRTEEPFFQDYRGDVWARSGPTDRNSSDECLVRDPPCAEMTVYYFYPLQPGFYFDLDADGVQDVETGECVGWLNGLEEPPDLPVPVTYELAWPADTPVLHVGETLLKPKRGLPNIVNQAAAEIVFDEIDPYLEEARTSLAQLIDPLSPRSVPLDALPSDATNNEGQLTEKLPFSLRTRVQFDPIAQELSFKGLLDESGAGEPLLLLNVMSGDEKKQLDDLSTDGTYRAAVAALYDLTRNPRKLDLDGTPGADTDLLIGLDDIKLSGDGEQEFEDDGTTPSRDGVADPFRVLGGNGALTAGSAAGTGYVTLAFNNDASLSPAPVSLNVIKVGCGPYQGEIKVIESDNVFDEQLTLRHSGDFGGEPEKFYFRWYRSTDPSCREEPCINPNADCPPDTCSPQNGWISPQEQEGPGLVSFTIEGSNETTLADNFFFVRYWAAKEDGTPEDFAYEVCAPPDSRPSPSEWAGSPGSLANNPRAQLAEGWIKRVIGGLNPFEARSDDFHDPDNPANTFASMLVQLGQRYEGDIAFNGNPANVNSVGMIETYETVLRRGLKLSTQGSPPVNFGPANDALLLVTGRIADFYMLLGNEAFADASDPTIGFDRESSLGNLAPAIFTFENQLASPLDEELALLRGRDDANAPTAARPVYNRLFWNFTTGEGEVAYAQAYNINDQNEDGFIDEDDAQILFPQGHGDAWGHYVTAIKSYYGLLRDPNFTWVPRSEKVSVASVPIEVDFLDERKFARAAAARAKAGAEIVDLVYRSNYVEDPTGQWQGYKDSDTDRAWGLDGWSRRAGQGAYFDWVVANAILPAKPGTCPQGAACGNHSNCEQGETCSIERKGTCRLSVTAGTCSLSAAPCEIDANCDEGETCDHEPATCEVDEDCRLGACTLSGVSCTSNAECGTCRLSDAPCRADDDCGTCGQSDAPCGVDGDCDVGEICNTEGDACNAEGDTCNTEGDTCSIIREGTCRRPCEVDDDCNGGECIVPESGIQKIARTTVHELDDIISQFQEIQTQIDEADRGHNPLGLAKGVVAFDIDPSLIDAGMTHFDQIYERALGALDNALRVFDHANKLSQALRRNQDTVNAFSSNTADQERDYMNRLVEIFGYPYSDDLGLGGTYASDYDGPDIYHYMYVDSSELTGNSAPAVQEISAFFKPMDTAGFDLPLLNRTDPFAGVENIEPKEVIYHLALDGTGLVKPASWTGRRRAPGELQVALSNLFQNRANFQKAIAEYDNHVKKIEDEVEILEVQHDVNADEILVKRNNRGTQARLSASIFVFKKTSAFFDDATNTAEKLGETAAEGLPKSVTAFGGDVMSPARFAILTISQVVSKGFNAIAFLSEVGEAAATHAKEDASLTTDIKLELLSNQFEVLQRVKALEQLVREEAPLRLEAYVQAEVVEQSIGNYLAKLADGERTVQELIAFRKAAAADTQTHRYRDMAFRIFRNDALQKYRAQFDMAARYAYLAATAYDYETNLLGSSGGAGRRFLTDIVRHRSLGQVIDGEPIAGSHGLADPLARMKQNFDVLRGQLGFNNPQTETNRFSLRTERFRLREASDDAWRTELQRHRVANLWEVPEFRRFARPFTPEFLGPQPGLVIPFSTTVTFAQNFFGWPLGGGDSAYDPTNFATKVRSVGVWFEGYNGAGLSNTPRVYLVPAGMDVLRSPNGFNFETRDWRVVDQKLPVPFPIGATDLANPNWIPLHDSLNEDLGGIRRFSSFRAYHASDEHATDQYDPSETTSDSRLVGRSVWNTRWVLIIPGGTLLADPDEGLDTFIHGQLIPAGDDEMDGKGITDILLFFQTYAFSGNKSLTAEEEELSGPVEAVPADLRIGKD